MKSSQGFFSDSNRESQHRGLQSASEGPDQGAMICRKVSASEE